MPSVMPNFFIVGAARSGTSSLVRYLGQHPEIYIPPWKEALFFAAESLPRCFAGPGDERLNRLIIRDPEQYARLFAAVREEKAIGESSVFYLCYPDAAERIARTITDPRIIVLLRNPVDRAYSAYMHLVRDGRETLTFAEGLDAEEERRRQNFEPIWWYKALGLYYGQVKHYLDVFGARRVHVVLYDDLCADPQRVLRDIFSFLGVREDIAVDTSIRYNVAGIPKSRWLYTILDNFIVDPSALGQRAKRLMPERLRATLANRLMNMILRRIPMEPQIRAQLRTWFAEDVAMLAELLHRDLSRWGAGPRTRMPVRDPAIEQDPQEDADGVHQG
jgi:hypothetical protein